ncbi:MAG: hypothetical protein HQ594_00010 [Candidatus Omnitrophica bacterium]|nr:hypothetical protein [Candidatus Omnitrophota bacterium]
MNLSNKKLTERELQIITSTLDEVIDKYTANENYILENPSDRKPLLFAIKSLFPKKRTCIIPGCSLHSIKHSHTIQKSHSLKLIAENNHVYTPLFSKITGVVEMQREGINQASTFPGFCRTHEALFHVFEKTKNLNSNEAMLLQIFRTIAREIVRNEAHLNDITKTKKDYLAFRKNKLLTILEREIKNKLPNISSLPHSLTIDCQDSKLDILNKKTKEFSSEIEMLRQTFFIPLYRHLFTDPGYSPPLYIANMSANQQIPVCLAGRANFVVDHNGETYDIPIIINTLPLEKTSVLFLVTHTKYTSHLNHYINTYQRSGLPALNMIETWMVRGSDHWFIKPSIWDNLPSTRKNRICTDIMDTRFNTGTIYTLSIFNSIRENAINDYVANSPNIDPSIQKQMENERKKL